MLKYSAMSLEENKGAEKFQSDQPKHKQLIQMLSFRVVPAYLKEIEKDANQLRRNTFSYTALVKKFRGKSDPTEAVAVSIKKLGSDTALLIAKISVLRAKLTGRNNVFLKIEGKDAEVSEFVNSCLVRLNAVEAKLGPLKGLTTKAASVVRKAQDVIKAVKAAKKVQGALQVLVRTFGAVSFQTWAIIGLIILVIIGLLIVAKPVIDSLLE